jgi:hypothetical protein
VKAGDEPVELGTQFIAYCHDWRKGWAKFSADAKLDEKMGRVGEGFHPPERDELGDMDETDWGLDDEGDPKDPWVFQHQLPIENVESGERYLFITSSVGGEIAIEILCTRWAREIKKGTHHGLPIIHPATSTFHTKNTAR